ncbi:MAG: sulfotransferase [Bacteroidia bacterium]
MTNSNKSPILVTGSHRSGSTWVGKVLSKSDDLGYMHEPFNPLYPTPRRSPINSWYLYVSKHNENIYKPFFSHTFNWNYESARRFRGINNQFKAMMWLKYGRIFMKNTGKTPLVKDPIALFSAPWLAKTFNMKVVMLIRHPAAFVYSLKRKDWEFPFHHLLRQEFLMQDLLADFRPEIEQFSKQREDIIAQGCLIWRIFYKTVAKFEKEHTNWIFLKHEDISRAPKKQFKLLFERLSLEFDDNVLKYLSKSTSAQNPEGTKGNEEQLNRNSIANIDYWKKKLSIEDLERIKALTEDVWPLYYTEKDW